MKTNIPKIDMDSATNDRYRAPALDRGLDILEVLSEQVRGLSRAEIIKELGVSPSQIYRMLERLVARGYVTRIDGDRYAITMKPYLLATRHPPLRRMLAQAQPLMDSFSLALRQSCHLVLPAEGCGIIVAQASPYSHFELRARIGGRIDLFHSGSGMTLLAFQSTDRIVEALSIWGISDIANKLASIEEDLDLVRQRGFRVGRSAQLIGVTDISVPILGPADQAVAVLTCPHIGHPDDEDPSTIDATIAAMTALVREITLR